MPAPAATSRPFARPSSANIAVVEQKYWGGVCLNVGCIPSKALLRNAELAHIFTKEAKTFGICGEAISTSGRRSTEPEGRRGRVEACTS